FLHANSSSTSPENPPSSLIERDDDAIGDIFYGRVDVDNNKPLILGRLLQFRDLAIAQSPRHEMLTSRRETARDQVLVAAQVDDAGVAVALHENIAIGALERGAGHDHARAVRAPAADLRGDGVQPRPPVLVGQRDAGAHFIDAALGMETVAILDDPSQPPAQRARDDAFARSRHAHDDQRAKGGASAGIHAVDPAAAV